MKLSIAALTTACVLSISEGVIAATVQYISPSTPIADDDTVWMRNSLATNSNATWPAGTSYTSNFGIAFKTGSSGPFEMDWIRLDLNTSTITSGLSSLKIELRAASNSTPYSAVASTTSYALDIVEFNMPSTTNTYFSIYLDPASIPNISGYQMASDSSYALIAYNPGNTIAMGRTTGLANGTTNTYYTVGDGFVALDTFRNNSANYTNNASSYPTVGISFGSTLSAVPEPTAIFSTAGLLGCGLMMRRRKR